MRILSDLSTLIGRLYGLAMTPFRVPEKTAIITGRLPKSNRIFIYDSPRFSRTNELVDEGKTPSREGTPQRKELDLTRHVDVLHKDIAGLIGLSQRKAISEGYSLDDINSEVLFRKSRIVFNSYKSNSEDGTPITFRDNKIKPNPDIPYGNIARDLVLGAITQETKVLSARLDVNNYDSIIKSLDRIAKSADLLSEVLDSSDFKRMINYIADRKRKFDEARDSSTGYFAEVYGKMSSDAEDTILALTGSQGTIEYARSIRTSPTQREPHKSKRQPIGI